MFFAMGRCKFPLYITETMAGEWFDLWRIVNETRMSRNSWTFLGFDRADISPSMLAFRVMVQRNHDKAKARFNRAVNPKEPEMEDDAEEEVWPDESTDEFFGCQRKSS